MEKFFEHIRSLEDFRGEAVPLYEQLEIAFCLQDRRSFLWCLNKGANPYVVDVIANRIGATNLSMAQTDLMKLADQYK